MAARPLGLLLALSAVSGILRLWRSETRRAAPGVETSHLPEGHASQAEIAHREKQSDAALRERLIDYLSKEIETHTTTTVAFRSRAHFTIYIGPFALLGALLLSGKLPVLQPSAEALGYVQGGLFGLFASYVAMATISFYNEQGAREQCDRWRTAIISLASGESWPITTRNQAGLLQSLQMTTHAKRSLMWGYFGAWGAMTIGISCTVLILWQLVPKVTSDPKPIPVYQVVPPK